MARRFDDTDYNIRLFEHSDIDSIEYDEEKEKRREEAQRKRKIKEEKAAKKLTKKDVKKRRRVMDLTGGIIFGAIVVFAIIAIIMGQVKLTEINQEIKDAKDDLAEKQSIYTQLEMKVDASLSTMIVERYAQEKLGMSKASNSQKEYINLSQGDKAEVTLKSHTNIFSSIAEAFSSMFS